VILHLYRWRGLYFLFEPRQIPAVGRFVGVGAFNSEALDAWQEHLIEAILEEASRN
jgi:hypothetical protein